MTDVENPSRCSVCRKILNWEHGVLKCFGFQITFRWNLLYMYLFFTTVIRPVMFCDVLITNLYSNISPWPLNHK